MNLDLTVPVADLGAASRHADRDIASATTVVLSDAERQPCEVWTRVMGYHRPVASFNTGKQAEHAERRFFRDQAA